MTPDTKLTEEQLVGVKLAEKIFRLAAKNSNAEEAASAVAKGQAILTKLNLDMAALEAFGDGEDGARMEQRLEGGYYQYQRDLWEAVAELNFCAYWNQMTHVDRKSFQPNATKTGFVEIITGDWVNQHRLVGRRVNVAGAKGMAAYLESAVDRIVDKHIRSNGEMKRSKWTTDFRKGVVETVVYAIYQRQREHMQEEDRLAAEARERQAQDIEAGASTEFGITLSSFKKSEEQANYDFMYGQGAWAERAAARREQALAQAEYEREQTRWAEEHPEEAAAEAAEERKRERRNAARRDRYAMENGYRYRAPREFTGDSQAYRAGRKAGKEIGIDAQAEGRGSQRRIAHG